VKYIHYEFRLCVVHTVLFKDTTKTCTAATLATLHPVDACCLGVNSVDCFFVHKCLFILWWCFWQNNIMGTVYSPNRVWKCCSGIEGLLVVGECAGSVDMWLFCRPAYTVRLTLQWWFDWRWQASAVTKRPLKAVWAEVLPGLECRLALHETVLFCVHSRSMSSCTDWWGRQVDWNSSSVGLSTVTDDRGSHYQVLGGDWTVTLNKEQLSSASTGPDMVLVHGLGQLKAMIRIHRRFWVINSWSVFSHDGIPGLLYMHHKHFDTRHFGTGVKVSVWHQCRSVWTLRIHWAGAEMSWAELSVFHCRLHNCCSVTRMNHASQSCPLHLYQQIPQCCHCLMECPQAEQGSDQTSSDVVVMMPWIWSCSRVQLDFCSVVSSFYLSSFFLAYSQTSQIGCLPYFHT